MHNKAGAFLWLAQDAEIMARARRVYQNLPASVFLRAADAIHLAAAAEAGLGIFIPMTRICSEPQGISASREKHP